MHISMHVAGTVPNRGVVQSIPCKGGSAFERVPLNKV